ncbi:peptidoglycan bridge formation glycyltransferase FemA/FemB family protein [candidate division KSB1 bacterium]|nr:peptidoglycan bridge formation glycyltransferase FemA/FemB family protein [candidate division KSB1 bacterium]
MHLTVSEEIPKNWNTYITSAKNEAGFYQSELWAHVKNKQDQSQPLFIEVDDSSNIVLTLLLFQKTPSNKINIKPATRFNNLISGDYRGWLEWIDGPVLHTQQFDLAFAALNCLFKWLDVYSMKHKLIRIRSDGFNHLSKWNSDTRIRSLFEKFKYSTSTWGTYLVDLTQDEDTLFGNIHQKARGKVRKASQLSLSIRQPENVDDYLKNWQDVYVASGIKQPLPPDIIEIMLEDKTRKFIYHYLVNDKKKRNLAVVSMYVFNKMARRVMSSISPVCRDERIPAQDLITWHCLLEAKKLGCHTFDFAGVNPNPQTSKEQGIKDFKSKWGGTYHEFYISEKNNYSVFYKGLTKLWQLKQRMLSN